MTIIGISGAARSGKDTFSDLLIEILTEKGIKCSKTSFAKQLKIECRDFVAKTLGIDVFTEDSYEKSIIRPLLVTWGTHVRRKLDENIWIKHLESSIEDNQVTIVTDVRFQNEFDWIKSKRGYSIFIDRVDENGDIVQPANSDEEENNALLRPKCDFHLTWNTLSEDKMSWLVAVAHEVLTKTVPEKEIESWTQTYPLLKK